MSISNPSQSNITENTQSSLTSIKEILSTHIKQAKTKDFLVNFQPNGDIVKIANHPSHNQTQITKPQHSILDYPFVTGKDDEVVFPTSSSPCIDLTSTSQVNHTPSQKKAKAHTKKKPLIKLKRSNSFNSINTNNNTAYERMMELKIKRDDRLNVMRLNKYREELKEMKTKPDIDSNSIQLACYNHNRQYTPIYKRVDVILKEHEMKIESIKSNIKQEEGHGSADNEKDKDYQQQRPQFSKWIEGNEIWEQTRKAKINYVKQGLINQEEQEREVFIYQPKINKKSNIIASQKINQQCPNISIGERLYNNHNEQQKRLRKKQRENMPSFHPFINHNYKIGQNYYFFMEENQMEMFSSNKDKKSK